jgi:hypothetical protein
MIVTVSGWRFWPKSSSPVVFQTLSGYLIRYGAALHVRVGDAEGVDKFTRDWLFEMESSGMGLTYCVYRANWSKFGRPAGPLRNGQMLRGDSSIDLRRGELAHRLVAFPEPGIDWRVPGSGTVDCMMQAVKLGITLEVPGVAAS